MNNPRKISGAIFPSQYQNGPAYTGILEVDGVKYKIALWSKTSAGGKQYLQISEDKKSKNTPTSSPFTGATSAYQQAQKDQEAFGKVVRGSVRGPDDMDDEIPF